PAAKLVYAKSIDGADFVAFHRHVFPGKLTGEDLRDLLVQHTTQVMRRQASRQPGDSLLSTALDTMPSDPDQGADYLRRLLGSDLIATAGLAQERDEDVRTVREQVLPMLALAYSKITHPIYGSAA